MRYSICDLSIDLAEFREEGVFVIGNKEYWLGHIHPHEFLNHLIKLLLSAAAVVGIIWSAATGPHPVKVFAVSSPFLLLFLVLTFTYAIDLAADFRNSVAYWRDKETYRRIVVGGILFPLLVAAMIVGATLLLKTSISAFLIVMFAPLILVFLLAIGVVVWIIMDAIRRR
jgi:hypothetical protein